MLSSTRHAVASEATDPNRSPWLRSTARSAIASPPSASITARSTATRPGSCPRSRRRNGANASLIAADRPIASARSATSRVPARPTTPRPSAVTTTFGREEVRFTLRVPLRLDRRNLRQVPSFQVEGHFHVYGTLNPPALVKDPGYRTLHYRTERQLRLLRQHGVLPQRRALPQDRVYSAIPATSPTIPKKPEADCLDASSLGSPS